MVTPIKVLDPFDNFISILATCQGFILNYGLDTCHVVHATPKINGLIPLFVR